MTKPKNPQIGGLFEDWLKEEGIHAEVTTASIKRVLAWQLEQAIKEGKITNCSYKRHYKLS